MHQNLQEGQESHTSIQEWSNSAEMTPHANGDANQILSRYAISFGTSPLSSSTMYFLGVMTFAILSPPENFLVAEI